MNKYNLLAIAEVSNDILAIAIIGFACYFHNYWLLLLLLVCSTGSLRHRILGGEQ